MTPIMFGMDSYPTPNDSCLRPSEILENFRPFMSDRVNLISRWGLWRNLCLGALGERVRVGGNSALLTARTKVELSVR